jgi:UDPglucose 6-dehydrogenase
MKILIAGYGFVGKAHHELLKDRHEIIIHDPALGYKADFADVDAVIVCVATPQREDGSCEMANVYDVIDLAPDVPVLIKSTISVEGWDMLVDAFPNRMLNFSPEFLRAASAVEDLQNMDLMLLGGTSCSFWSKVFDVDVEIADPRELILTKYARNSFLALKVAFFNQMYDLCKAIDIEYDAVARYTGMDKRIGNSHTTVTEERGFGGHCFPKDTSALVKTAQKNNVDLSILIEARNYNDRIQRK